AATGRSACCGLHYGTPPRSATRRPARARRASCSSRRWPRSWSGAPRRIRWSWSWRTCSGRTWPRCARCRRWPGGWPGRRSPWSSPCAPRRVPRIWTTWWTGWWAPGAGCCTWGRWPTTTSRGWPRPFSGAPRGGRCGSGWPPPVATRCSSSSCSTLWPRRERSTPRASWSPPGRCCRRRPGRRSFGGCPTWTGGVLDMLQAAAVLGASFSPAALASATGRSVVDLVPALAEAARAGLLADEPAGGPAGERLAFRHAVIRESIYHSLPAAGRGAPPREAGGALAAAGAPADEVAGQLAQGAHPGDAEAVGWLRRAAHAALPSSVPMAAGLLERALDLGGPGFPERAALATELVPLLALSGRV